MTDNNDMPEKIWVLRGDSISPPNWSVIPFGCSEPYHHDRVVQGIVGALKRIGNGEGYYGAQAREYKEIATKGPENA